MTTVLLVEDDPAISEPLARAFGREGYEVRAHGTGKGALEEIAGADIIVLDLGLPDIDGLDVARQVRAQGLTTPILMLTAFSQSELVERARDAGVMGYLVKPFGASEVVPAIEVAIGRFAELRAIEEELANLEDRFESRKIIDQAKGMLQEGLGLTEPEAFRWIQKTAMDLRKSMREVAEGVISHKRKK